ncbi:hypothetical protein Peur_044548 [Populus x canadensis]
MLKMIPPTRNSPFLESPPANSSFQKIINFASSSPDEERWSTGIIIITLAYAPPLPKHFRDCEVHSGPPPPKHGHIPTMEEQGAGMDGEELNMMNSVMNKLFQMEYVSDNTCREIELENEVDDAIKTIDNSQLKRE